MWLINLPFEFVKKTWYTMTAKRLGPDMYGTHWMLHFRSSMKWLCKRKFGGFSDSADFRPGSYAFITENIFLGDRVVIRSGTVLGGDDNSTLTIEEDVMIGMNTHIYANNHRFDDPSKLICDQGYTDADVLIKKDCWIGANVTILAGVTIGAHTVIAAGSVVTKDVPTRCVAGGIPAKVIKEIK